jgi:putative DNA primase/helicase
LAARVEPDGAATWLCHRCGWRGAVAAPGRTPRRAPRPAAPAPEPQPEANRELAKNIWLEATNIPPAGIARAYLVEVRGLTVWDQDRLRWHPECPWSGVPGGRTGCIIAPVNAAVGGLVVGVWRIRAVLTGKVERRGLGPTKGNASRLFWAPGPQIAVTEGVEDALAYQELSGVPAWAALSAGNMAELVLPVRLSEVQVVADADPAGLDNGAELVRRLRAEGRTARLIKPHHHKDANDVLRARRPSA